MRQSETSIIDELLIRYDSVMLVMLGLELRRLLNGSVEQWGLGWQGQSVLISLYALAEHGTVSQKQLAGFVGIDPRNLVQIIDTLEQRNMLRRIPSSTDRRKYEIRLTRQGKKMVEQYSEVRAKLEEDLLLCLTENEKRTFHKTLVKIWERSDVLEGYRVYKLGHGIRKEGTIENEDHNT